MHIFKHGMSVKFWGYTHGIYCTYHLYLRNKFFTREHNKIIIMMMMMILMVVVMVVVLMMIMMTIMQLVVVVVVMRIVLTYLLLQTKEFWLDYSLITWTYMHVFQVLVHNLNWILSLDCKFILSKEDINAIQFAAVKSVVGM